MRNPQKLKAFQLSDQLVLKVYASTQTFPRDEDYVLRSQIRRSAISIPSNIVEGCARDSEKEYTHFLNISYASSKELEYQLSLAYRLGYLGKADYESLSELSDHTCRTLNNLQRSYKTH